MSMSTQIEAEVVTFGGIETGDLNNVIAFWPVQHMHLLFRAQVSEFSHVVLGVPVEM